MTHILNIETSTKNCSVSIAKNGALISLKEINNGGYSHAEMLHPLIKEALLESKLTINQIDAIAVGKGPGSYTGLRIGVSAAKGLCFANDIIARDIELPKAEDGDYLVIHDNGAYTFGMWSKYVSRFLVLSEQNFRSRLYRFLAVSLNCVMF